MECSRYRALYPKYQKLPVPRALWDGEEHEAHTEHFHDCDACSDWTLARRVENRGAKVEDYPCVHIAYRVTGKLVSTRNDPFDDPDITIWQFEGSQTYGIPIRDGGSSIDAIAYCPWCGIALPEENEDDQTGRSDE